MPSKVFDAKNRLVNAQFAHLQLLSPSLHRVYFTKFLADDDQDTRTSSGQSNEWRNSVLTAKAAGVPVEPFIHCICSSLACGLK